MVMAGTPQDQELMAEGKDFCLQNEASSEPNLAGGRRIG